jgi:hypothetical protein
MILGMWSPFWERVERVERWAGVAAPAQREEMSARGDYVPVGGRRCDVRDVYIARSRRSVQIVHRPYGAWKGRVPECR